MLRTNQIINYNWEEELGKKKKKRQETGISLPNPTVWKDGQAFQELGKAVNHHHIL